MPEMVPLFEDLPPGPKKPMRERAEPLQTADEIPAQQPDLFSPPEPIQTHFPLLEKDPYGEWQNPYDLKVEDIRKELERIPNDYFYSAGWVRANRPRVSREGLSFWNNPYAKAQLVNALLMRGERTVKQVQQDIEIPADKIYSYLPRWGLEFKIVGRDAVLLDALGAKYNVTVQEWKRPTAEAVVQVNGYMVALTARYDRDQHLFLTKDTLNLNESSHITFELAAKLANLSLSTVREVFPADVRTVKGHKLISLERFQTVFPEDEWDMSLAEALQSSNPCNCVFWNSHTRRCQFGHQIPEMGTAHITCEDFNEWKL